MTQARLNRVDRVLAKRQPDVAVLLDQVHKAHNLSAIIRSCDAVGVPQVHAVESHEALKLFRGTSMGSDQWVGLTIHDDFDQAFDTIKAQGMTVYAAHLSDQAIDFRQADFTQPCAILMGAEKWGVSEHAAQRADQHIIIPMMGMVESLNVSVATAVILYELQRQRDQAGLYDQCHLDARTLGQTRFEWMQPKMARYYHNKGQPYPELDEDGDIVKP
jgi:tRNA (guanosine-2'-O-)-methyltransferase